MSIIAEAPDFIQVFSDGTVKRFIPQTTTSSTEPKQNTTYKHNSKSKDIVINSSKNITARIFHPYETETESQCRDVALPVMVYFHGGGFCIGSTTWLGYHFFLADLSATANIIILSVDYRLAPENKLPIAYEDCFSALEWLECSSDEWLRRADFSNVFLSGDSAGGNIAHHVALKAMIKSCNVRVKGIVSIHPYFGSERRTELETSEDSGRDVAMNDMFWKLSLPDGADRDFYGCNFEEGVEGVEWGIFPKSLVCVAEKDFLKERGVMYYEFLKRKGVKEVRFVETKNESHVFHVWEPDSKATRVFQKQITDFIRSV